MRLTDRLRTRLRRNAAWTDLRRVQREGFGRGWRRWRLWSRILETPPVKTAPPRPGVGVEVHVLCYRLDYLYAIWALKSFYHQAGVDYPIVLHVQGTPPARAVAKLRSHFPHARLVLQREADQVVGNQLRARGLRRLEAARRESPFMLKLTDFALTSLAANILILDSDVLFFRQPRALLDLGDDPVERCLFQRDPASTYNVTEELARAELGIPLAPRINTGIVVFPRERFDLARCEAFLEHPQVARRTGWIEQTLYALWASEDAQFDYLPDDYLVSLDRGLPCEGLVARHYAGPSRVLLTEEGMPFLARGGFLRDGRSQVGLNVLLS